MGARRAPKPPEPEAHVEVEVETVPADDTLELGASGDAVAEVQARLNETGCRLVVDGEFGGGTQAMVCMFQDHHRLKIDGVVGPATRRALGV